MDGYSVVGAVDGGSVGIITGENVEKNPRVEDGDSVDTFVERKVGEMLDGNSLGA